MPPSPTQGALSSDGCLPIANCFAADSRWNDPEGSRQPSDVRRIEGHKPARIRITFGSNKSGNGLEALQFDGGLSSEEVNNIAFGLPLAHSQCPAFLIDWLS